MLGRLFCFCVAAGLLGCSTTPQDPGLARAVPAERVYSADLLVPSSERSAQIVVIRDQGIKGSACSYVISVDKVKVVALRTSESSAVHVAPGSHFLTLETTGGLCGSTNMSQNVVIASGERQVYRAIQPSAGEAHLSRIE